MNMLWQEQIRSLKMSNSGVQKYTDKFIKLAGRLKWNLNDDVAIAAEAAAIATGIEAPGGVTLLGQMALRIEANHKGRSILIQPRNEKEKTKCSFCNKYGHSVSLRRNPQMQRYQSSKIKHWTLKVKQS